MKHVTRSLLNGSSVVSGADAKAYTRARGDQFFKLMFGEAELFIPLNGGSDTRRGMREYWQEWADMLMLEFWGYGSHVIIRGPSRHTPETLAKQFGRSRT